MCVQVVSEQNRAQRNHAVVSIGDDGCAQYAVRVGDGAGVGTGFGTALTALNFAGVVELRGIECHKDALLVFGPPSTGKSHLSSAIRLALVENGYRVLFTRTTDLVQHLQRARRELTFENLLARLDRYHLLILDDFACVSKDQAETSVLFELISVRSERRSILITANQPFDQWHKVFPDQSTAVAAVDRLVHHATILEMNVESYRRRHAVEQLRDKPARASKRATVKKLSPSPFKTDS